MALSLLLLVAAGLLIRSFTLLLDVNPGFNPRGVLAVQLNLPAARYTEVRTRQFYRQLLDRLGSLPGVQSAGAGIYGVLSYSVAQRTREFGIRMALGASRTAMIGQVLWRGARLALSGVGVGLLLAPILTRCISTQLFGVGSLDPITFVASGATVVAFALLACWIPARRASAVDPVRAIRAD